MRRLILFAILVSGVLYAPLPLIAQKGGGQAPLIPVADMPNASGGATAPSEPPLEVDPSEAPDSCRRSRSTRAVEPRPRASRPRRFSRPSPRR